MTHTVLHGDCLELMPMLGENSVDSIVTDPPYGLSFMGKDWDHGVPGVHFWQEAFKVLKPGGFLLAFGGTRTFHRLACAIEDAGFELRDTIMWVYGCLDEQTELVTSEGVIPYHKAKIGDLALCYNTKDGEYSYQPILEIVEYDYSDTAYRLIGDFGEQVVSRNHRVITECGGGEIFELAETLQSEVRVPILEDLPALQQALYDAQPLPSGAEQNLRPPMCECAYRSSQLGGEAVGATERAGDLLPDLRERNMETGSVVAESSLTNLQPGVQRCTPGCGLGQTRAQGAGELDAGIGSRPQVQNDGRSKPRMERGLNLSQSQGGIRTPADQVRQMFCGNDQHGPQGWLRDGTSVARGRGDQEAVDADGGSSSHQPRRDRQPIEEPDAVQDERATQGIRAWGGHRSAMVRVVPFHYTGKVWCVRVPTGAFVAVRNGVAFPTGNSGFPKSLDVSKAIDKAAGAEREVIGFDAAAGAKRTAAVGTNSFGDYKGQSGDITVPATDAARQWEGWGTALKPAFEPIIVARKPLDGTVAANVLKWGTGGLNIDGCRVAIDPAVDDPRLGGKGDWSSDKMAKNVYEGGYAGERVGSSPLGRWPANLIHDGSDEVLALFPDSKGQLAKASTSDTQRAGQNTYGSMTRGLNGQEPRNDSGSAARFFYCAKASKADRGANHHPTVKPTDLMRYLCRLVTPPGGLVLDPFTGSGSTGKAAVLEGFGFIGCELQAEYVAIAQARIEAAAK